MRKIKWVLSAVLLLSLIKISAVGTSPSEVIYGEDNRVDAYLLNASFWDDKAESVAMQVENRKIMSTGDKNLFKLEGPTLEVSKRLCPEERFAKQKVVGHCSGFLVKENILITAGHCIENFEQCKNFSWVFDYKLTHKYDRDYDKIASKNIYHCKKVLSQFYRPGSQDKRDYAVIELDREAKNRRPLEFRTFGKIQIGDKLAVIGHPDGIPLKFAGGASVMKNNEQAYFSASLDTFRVNSGSPVFNSLTGVVEGILVRGRADYKYDRENKCNRVNVIKEECEKGKCNFEDVSRITSVPGIY